MTLIKHRISIKRKLINFITGKTEQFNSVLKWYDDSEYYINQQLEMCGDAKIRKYLVSDLAMIKAARKNYYHEGLKTNVLFNFN